MRTENTGRIRESTAEAPNQMPEHIFSSFLYAPIDVTDKIDVPLTFRRNKPRH